QAACLSALLATILGTLGGISLARAKRSTLLTVGLVALLAISLMTPEVVDGIAYLPWFVTLGVDANITMFNNGLVRLIVSHAMFSIAHVTFIVRARMAGINEQREEEGAEHGATCSARVRDITHANSIEGSLLD